MKKASKVLILILVAVFVLGTFSGCGVFSKNTEKYRNAEAFYVANEKITVGKLIDTFNSTYNTYASIYQGITADTIFSITMSSLYTQYIKVAAYKAANPKQAPANRRFENEEYLEPEELDFAIAYIKYVLFHALDGLVESYVKADYTLKDAETKDTSRDFKTYDDLKGCSSYSEYKYKQNFVNEDMDEYLEKYYDGLYTTTSLSIDEYVYQASAKTSQGAVNKLTDLNDRIEEGEITFEKYTELQKQALEQYKKNVISSYKYDLDKLVVRQIEDFILSAIVAKYNYSVYATIDTGDGLAETVSELSKNRDDLIANQKAGFKVNKDYVKFIEGLSDSSYIYAISDEYTYIFVKNILIPFSAEQKTLLSNIQSEHGTDSDELYLTKRKELAAAVVAEDFFADADSDARKVSDVFALDAGGNLVINSTGALGQYFDEATHKVVPMTKDGQTLTEEETIVELMKQYNTDTAQHSTIYDYVVRVGDENYTGNWVAEFSKAADQAWKDANGANGGTYALAISTYGVHIVYFNKVVAAQTFDYDELLKTGKIGQYTDTPAYRTFVTYFDSQSSTRMEEDLESLQKLYYPQITVNSSVFNRFLSDNGITFDFDASVKLDDED